MTSTMGEPFRVQKGPHKVYADDRPEYHDRGGRQRAYANSRVQNPAVIGTE